jgi:hypothetical protein
VKHTCKRNGAGGIYEPGCPRCDELKALKAAPNKPEVPDDEEVITAEPVEALAPMQTPFSAPAPDIFAEPDPVRSEEVAKAAGFHKELAPTTKAEITKQAKAKVQEEILKKAKEDFLKEEMARLRAEAGISKTGLGGHHDDLVSITIDLSDENDADPWIQLDMPHGMKYHHGKTYTVARHIANDLNWIMFRGKLHNLNKDGKSVFKNRTRGTVLSAVKGATDTGKALM